MITEGLAGKKISKGAKPFAPTPAEKITADLGMNIEHARRYIAPE